METSKTTWQDFSTAEYLGNSAIKDTFERAFKRGQEDYEYLTECQTVLRAVGASRFLRLR